MRKYFKALAKACIEKPIEFLTLSTTVIGLCAALVSVVILRDQLIGFNKSLESQNELLESQAYNYIDSNQIELDKLFVEKSEYKQYFYNNAPLPNSTDAHGKEDLQKIVALTDLKLDIIDSFYTQEHHIKWDSRYTREAWDRYYKNSFAKSDILCQTICRDWEEYGKGIREIAKDEKACGSKIRPKDPDHAEKGCDWVQSFESLKK